MVDTGAFKTYVEELPDHDCTLDTKNMIEQAVYDGEHPTRLLRFRKTFQRARLISRQHPYTNTLFKSTAAVGVEVMRHMKISSITIHPFSLFRSNWEIFMVFVYILQMQFFPFFLVWHSHHVIDRRNNVLEYVIWDYVILSLNLSTFLDIVVNFLSGYVVYDTQEVVLAKKDIACAYLKSYFFFDLISCLPYGYVLLVMGRILSPEYQWLECIHLLRFVRIFTLKSYCRQSAKRMKMGFFVRKFFGVAMFTFMYINITGCGYLLAAMTVDGRHDLKAQMKADQGPDKDKSWLHKMTLWNKTMEQVWRVCFMRAVSNTFACGFVTSFSQVQDLLANILFGITGLIVTVMIAVEIVVIARTMHAGDVLYEEMTNQLREYLRYKKVPSDLRKRLSGYFQFCFEKTYYHEPTILTFLSGQLKQDILLHKSRYLVETVGFFKAIPPLQMIKLVANLNDQVALHHEVIVKCGAISDKMYFIRTGTVAVFSITGSELCHLVEGAHFGELCLVVEEPMAVSVVALETTRLWTLSHAAFNRALEPTDDYLQALVRAARQRDGFVRTSKDSLFTDPDPHRPLEVPSFVRRLRRKNKEAMDAHERRMLQNPGPSKMSLKMHESDRNEWSTAEEPPDSPDESSDSDLAAAPGAVRSSHKVGRAAATAKKH